MIFVANTLQMNGGTTFLIRTCEALQSQGRRCAVLVLRDAVDEALASELARHAEIIRLWDFQRDGGRLMRAHFGVFAPIAWHDLAAALAPFGNALHAMGAFGLILGARLVARMPQIRLTVGVYHQNEFLYRNQELFAREVLKLFRRVPPENVLFFNEASRANYAAFHRDSRYEGSPLAPIGIRMRDGERPWAGGGTRKIVSVGNLEAFKTYNANMIALLPQLRKEFPGVSYHVYGTGDQRERLEELARRNQVSDSVMFHGRIAYEQLDTVWQHADMFVGSGTALVEAAAVGLPALIGVESVKTPVTYGFLCDVSGLSYNELVKDAPVRPMIDCIREILGSRPRWEEVATACASKAQEFSVDRTAFKLMELAADAKSTPALLSPARSFVMLMALPVMAVAGRLFPKAAFAHRRNQSYIMDSKCAQSPSR